MPTSPEVKENLYTALKALGLTESEINLYTISLVLGPSPISTLAKNINIPRPNIYKIISGLEKHGLAKFTGREKYARNFMVESPTLVLEKIRKKREAGAYIENILVSSMPELLSLYRQGDSPTKIRIFEGKEQWLKIFFQVLDETKESMIYFGSADAFIEIISWETEREWIKKRTQKGIHINVLLTPGKDAETLKEADEQEKRTTRLFNGAIPFVTGFMLYANKVIIWQPKAPLVVLIEDEYIIQMLRSIFDVLWEKSKTT